jgi:hypothetical protein
MKIKMIINNKNGTVIDFDIVGYGNVLMDYEYGTFDCRSFVDTKEANDEFEQMILNNIDTIIEKLTKPSLERVQREIDKIKDMVLILDTIQTDEEREIVSNWIDRSLPVLIEAEDYERCSIIKQLKDKLW